MPLRDLRRPPLRGANALVLPQHLREAAPALECRTRACAPARRARGAREPRSGAEAVADPAHGLEPVLAELPAQVADVDVDDVRPRVVVVAPDARQQLLAAQDLVRVLRKVRRSSNSRALSSTVSPLTLAQRVRRSSADPADPQLVCSAGRSSPRSRTRIRATSSSK